MLLSLFKGVLNDRITEFYEVEINQLHKSVKRLIYACFLGFSRRFSRWSSRGATQSGTPTKL